MPLKWSDPSPPNDDCGYDHVVAPTPIGEISIEWKSWKDYPGYGASMPWDEYVNGNSLDEAKKNVQSAWDKMVSTLARDQEVVRISELEAIVQAQRAMLAEISEAAGFRTGETYSAASIVARLKDKS